MNLIDELGGPAAIGGALGVTPQAVSNWRRRGWPDGAKWKLLELAHKRGIKLTLRELTERLPAQSDGVRHV